MFRKGIAILLTLALAVMLLPVPTAMASSGSGDVAFTDVPPGSYYAIPVQWAVRNQITSGTTATTFSPDRTCTRGEIITLLWKTVGCPEPKGQSTFSDVVPNSYYAKATAWGQENGILDGKLFRPNENCTRLSAVEFIWRNAGRPAARKSAFTDANWQSVDWAVSQGIVSGTSATTFTPYGTCTRGQIITMLYRALAKDISWYFLYVIFRNTDIQYTNASGKQIRYQNTMTDQEVSLLTRDAQLYANDIYSMSGCIVYPHVDVLVVDSPITFADLSPYEGTQYKLSAESVRPKLPDTINLDAYDHVTVIADISKEAAGNADYIALGGSHFGQYTGYAFIRNEGTAYTLEKYNEGKRWTSATLIHELLHFMDYWSQALWVSIPGESHDIAGHRDSYWDYRESYAAYMTYNYALADGYPAGIPCAAWRRPPRQFRDAADAQHTHKAGFAATFEPAFGYTGADRIPETCRFANGVYVGQTWNGQPNGYGRILYDNAALYRGSWLGGKQSGYGRMEYRDGTVYEGSWKNGQRDGWGKLKGSDGTSYTGEWRADSFEGYGKRVYADGSFYIGEWKDGQPEGYGIFKSSAITYFGQWKDGQRSGQGMFGWPNGTSYTGAVQEGQPNGYGVMVNGSSTAVPGQWKDGKFVRKTEDTAVQSIAGSLYAGQMKNGQWNRYGKLWQNGHTYSGVWKDGVLSGLVWCTGADGSSYFGYWRDGTSNGWGVYIWPEGDMYIGSFQDGRMHGYGKFIGANGSFYCGEFAEDQRTGYGTFVWPDGDVYEGMFLNGTMDGRGKYTWTCGNVYEGQWKNDQRDGTGMMLCADGRVLAGQWKSNAYMGSAGRETRSVYTEDGAYTGQMLDGKADGFGIMQFEDGSLYAGEWTNGQRSGYGRLEYTNGNVYRGEWKSDTRQGTGQITWPNGHVSVGEWADSTRRGFAKYVWPSGEIYEGDWDGEVPNGYGTMRYTDGTVQTGQWKDGNYAG